MPRKPTGQVIAPQGKQRSWAIRFRAYGKRRYVTLGRPEEGWTRERAEAALRHVLADVERGIWRPHEPEPIAACVEAPTFHEFASEWLAARTPELAAKNMKDYTWSLSYHLLPYFARHRLSEITVEEVDRYRAVKVREGRLAPAQINKTLKRLAQILEVAVDYGYLPRNPAASKGGRRRVREPKPRRSWVEPEQLLALLEAAPGGHRPIVATLAGAGLRVGEACALNWRDVNLATGTIQVGKGKTDAGTWRLVDLPLGLADELRVHRATRPSAGSDDPVFLCRGRNGRRSRQTPDNVGRRLKTSIRRANVTLEARGIEPISERVTPHSLRRTYASLRAACGDDPVYIAEQLGHEDPTFTIRVYAKAAKRRERLSGEYLATFDRALEWAAMGSGAESDRSDRSETPLPRLSESASQSHRLESRPRSSAG
jgi:integrase